MNSCPDTDAVFAFAENPVQENNAEIAAHILSCPVCQQTFRIARDAIAMSAVADLEPDNEEIRNTVFRVTHTYYWQKKLKDTIQFLCSLLEKNAFVLVDPKSLPWLKKNLDEKGLVFAAKPETTPPSIPAVGSDFFVIRFDSCREKSSRYYWTAELSLPRVLHDRVVMPIKVMDANGKSIESGKLIYLGIELTIVNGKAGLTAQNFKDSLKGHGISVIFGDGTVVPGQINPELEI